MMTCTRLSNFFWLIFLPYLSFGQLRDTAYVQPINSKLILGARLSVKDYQMAFHSPVDGILHFQNAGINLGFRAKYKKVGLSFSLPLTSLNSPASGNPKHLGFSVNLYRPSFFLRAGLRRFSGFTELDADPAVFRSDMKMWHGTLRGFYLLNHPRFSLRSSFKLNERQKKNQGSFLISALLGTQVLDTDSLNITLRNQNKLQLEGYRSYKFGLGGGYAYTFTHKRWFATLAATTGGEFRRINFNTA